MTDGTGARDSLDAQLPKPGDDVVWCAGSTEFVPDEAIWEFE